MRLVIAALVALYPAAASARCASGEPTDVRCKPQDFLQPPIDNQAFYLTNPVARRAELYLCAHARYLRPVDCTAAETAERRANGR